MASLASLGRVFSHRNASIYFGASTLCWTGLWVQRIAVDWLAWELTHSPAWVGVLVFCGLFPSVIVSPIAGAIADRVDRVRMATIVQFGLAAHSLVLPRNDVDDLSRQTAARYFWMKLAICPRSCKPGYCVCCPTGSSIAWAAIRR